MEIELRNISFKYPGSERFVLDDVSFKVKPGSLVCIVGYNGAGKSTLLDLICRIVDPTQGEVYVNGVNAREYASADLYHAISCQYQYTPRSDVTIREFMHMGDITDLDDNLKMEQCIKAAGMESVIARFPKGLEARLGPYPADPDPVSFYNGIVKLGLEGCNDPWENTNTNQTEKEAKDQELNEEDEEDEEDDDVVVRPSSTGGPANLNLKGRDCAFSPGEWRKLCFARTLMKRNADLR